MVNPIISGFILLPLYIYPSLNAWKPLFDNATAYVNDLTFLAIINPNSGPGGQNCPNSDYIAAVKSLNTHPNIVALGYVHTTFGKESQAALQNNITRYQNWSKPTTANGCGIQVNGIFFDEAPTQASSVTYMKTISTYARSTLTNGKTIVYNPGVHVDPGYWQWADYINVFEDTEANYRKANIPALTDNNQTYTKKGTVIIHTYTSSSQQENDDVDKVIDTDPPNYGLAGVFITDRTLAQNPFSAFPARWTDLVKWVAAAN